MNACAYIVGREDGPGAALSDMAKDLGFHTVLPFPGVALAERQSMQTPVCFFLFAAVDDVQALAGPAQAIRFFPSRRIRFSPLIYFSESPSAEAIRLCIGMGFDDVLTLPFTHARVLDRLNRQLDNPLTYYETADYFGPDRRGSQRPTEQQKRMRTGGQFRRLEITRSLDNGVSVLREDSLAA